MIEITRVALVTVALVLTFCLTFMKNKNRGINKQIVTINKQIDLLEKKKKLLNVELSYLTSPKRLLEIIDRHPTILGDKIETRILQVQTKEHFRKFSKNKTLKDRIITSNNTERKNTRI
ncbi:MAG: hypothetical protein LBC92_04660 [Rickettsiales bacterium]|jgi:hypothetical protein|nr:hypothetical protein [Rickettsiales bacterium]